MNPQGETPAGEDEWWDRLYDDTAPDTLPAATGDTLDDRFDSVSGTVAEAPGTPPQEPPRTAGDLGPPSPPDVPAQAPAPVPPPRQPPAPPRPPTEGARPRAWWERETAQPPPPRAPWEPPGATGGPRAFPAAPPAAPRPAAAARPEAPPAVPAAPPAAPPHPFGPPRPRTGHVGDGPPTYGAEPTALPLAHADQLGELVADTVLDGARYGTYTLRAVSLRGDSARYRGEPRRDALLTARFGTGDASLVLAAVATGARGAGGAHLAAADVCRWIGAAVGRSHARLAEDIRAGHRADLKSGLHRLVDRTYGRLRARAAELGAEPGEYTARLRCLLLTADPECRTRVFFGVGEGGLFRLRDGVWQDIEPEVPSSATASGGPVVGFGSPPSPLEQTPEQTPEETPGGDRPTLDLDIPTPPSPYVERPVPPPAEPFRFRASVARPGDTLLLAGQGWADPLRGEPALAKELAERWGAGGPPGLAAFLADTQLRVKGYADDRTGVAIWEA
ncbi:protein phosphatase 2C domain-containing protein [Streptomyces sp. SP18CS02]|uniref:protein phosphatase 2C domain-containing protein n=1 Tax=Streptomyces sp. SP18CS02 TaxID=3002531 RepID=UPI002E7A6A05|nr:protein phosphatase 2C domain-containing protein [Streptomyces sp. SP18CS02]MEE1756597.1 protein phosphatase 2C domain-containing protein [Streptomyces sp. SP18CS02]